MRQLRGFTLVETIIVVALIAGAMAVTLAVWTQRAREQSADRFVAQAAAEMAMLARATSSYFTPERVGALTDNVAAELQISTLVTEGLLPGNFAMRGGVLGTSVFGQRYQIRYMRLPGAAGRPPTAAFVVTELGVPQVASLSRTATPNTEQGILTLKTRIATRVSEEHKFSSGTVARNTRIAQGGFRGFTLDLSAYLPTSPTQAVAVVLGNFQELATEIQVPGPPGGIGAGLNCDIASGVNDTCLRRNPFTGAYNPVSSCWGQSTSDGATHYRDPVLPPNAQFVTRIPICGSFGVLTPGVPGVGLTFGTFQNQFNVNLPECWANGTRFDPVTAQASESYESVRLNDGEIFRTTCSLQMPERDANCGVVLRGRLTDISRIKQTTNVTTNTVNGTQTYTPLQPMPGNTLSQGAETRGHWFFCTPAT